VICTEELFSGDGTALAFRQLRDQNITIHQAIHILMPNNITDVSFLLAKSTLQQTSKIEKKKAQIIRIANRVLNGKTYKHGRRFYSRFLGYALQRSFGRRVVLKLKKKVQIHHDACVLCGQCVEQCPVNNLSIKDSEVITHDNCTLCYRCVNICPTKAISLLSKTPPKKQYYLNKKT
jgi:ferredoxin